MSDPELSKRVAVALAALPVGEAVVDAVFERDRAAARLAGTDPLWLRALPMPGAPSGDGYGPAPRDPAWIRVVRGTADVRVLAQAEVPSVAEAHAVSASMTATRVTWGTSAAPSVKHIVHGSIAIEPGGPFVVSSAVTEDEAEARARVLAVMAPLASALGLTLEGAEPELGAVGAVGVVGAVGAGTGGAAAPAPGEATTSDAIATSASSEVARELGRFSFGWEGDRRVLRDLVNPGPRASGWIWSAIALASGVGAGVMLLSLANGLRAGVPWTSTAASAGVATVFALGAFTFVHVARHALRYRAAGTPIAVFADDRVVVMPWVGRNGAIDPRPEGRFGAGVRIAEVRKVHVLERDGVPTVSLDTDHGEIDVAGGLGVGALEALRLAIEQAGAGVGAPRRKSASARARERTRQAEAAPPPAAT